MVTTPELRAVGWVQVHQSIGARAAPASTGARVLGGMLTLRGTARSSFASAVARDDKD